MNVNDDEAIAANLKKSLESTNKGFMVLLGSLRNSGFEEAIPKYRELHRVLIQQKLWCENKERNELKSLWQEIASQTGQIQRILSPMSEIMEELKTIDTVTSKTGNRNLQSKIIDILSKDRFIPVDCITSLLGRDKKEILIAAQILVRNGKVERRGKAESLQYRLCSRK
jgi:hypothetical protein